MNHPDLDKAVLGLWLANDGLNNFLDDHAARNDEEATGLESDCSCLQCAEARGLLYVAKIALARLQRHLGKFTPIMRKLRGQHLPDIYTWMEAIARMKQPRQDPEEADEPDEPEQ